MGKSYKELISGYREFRENISDNLVFAGKQKPRFLVISCSDSRVIPNFIFKAAAGDMFITRNIGGLVPPYDERHTSYHGTSAVIEYAVKILKVKHIMILGHTKCGGVSAMVKNTYKNNGETDFVSKWMEIAKPALVKAATKGRSVKERCTLCEREIIKTSLQNLRSFPFITEAAQKKRLKLHGMIFDIDTRKLYEYQNSSDEFKEII